MLRTGQGLLETSGKEEQTEMREMLISAAAAVTTTARCCVVEEEVDVVRLGSRRGRPK